MGKRADQKQRTRRALIEAALTLSAEHGFTSLSLRQVTRAAGIAPNSFYRHFRDMDELGLTLIDEVGTGLRQLMREARTRLVTGEGVVQTSVDTFLDYVGQNPNHFRLLLGERSGSSPAFREALYKEVNRFVEELVVFMEEASAAANERLAFVPEVAEAMITVVFNVGAEALDLPLHRRSVVGERIVRQMRILLLGSQAMAKLIEEEGAPSTDGG